MDPKYIIPLRRGEKYQMAYLIKIQPESTVSMYGFFYYYYFFRDEQIDLKKNYITSKVRKKICSKNSEKNLKNL